MGWFQKEVLSDDERRHALAHELGVPFVLLDPFELMQEALVLIPEPLAREHNAVAYHLDGGTVQVALLRMEDLEHLDFLRPRYRVLARLTSRESLTRALLHYQKHLRGVFGAQLQQDSPTLLDALLKHALLSHATDVHLESSAQELRVRYRINGVLKESMALSGASYRSIRARLQSLGSMPAAGRESRLRADLGHGEEVLLRVALIPTVRGEKLTMSLARASQHGWSLESLGFHGAALERVHQALARRKGLVAVSGAGTTTLLYTMLDLLNTPELAVATVEESVGTELPRVAQTSLAESGLTAAAALRAALKADPDVLMVDAPLTAEAVDLLQKAAQRGVFMLAAAKDESVFENPTLSIRSRLVRRVCGKKFLDNARLLRAQAAALEEAGADLAKVLGALKEERKAGKDAQWKEVQFPKAAGCSECEGGYLGQIGLHEVRAAGEESYLNVLEDGIFKAATGQTTLEELQNL